MTGGASQSDSHTTFFRQGGWLVLATGLSGLFMFATQLVAQRMPAAEYQLFVVLLRVYLLLGIPSIGLQTVFAQQTAAALTSGQEDQLRATVRAVLRGTLLLWGGVAALAFAAQPWLLRTLKVSNPAALWITLGMGLGCLWAPVLRGLVQGRQRFRPLGFALIADGVGRFAVVAVIVWLGGYAAGGLAGALAGLAGSTLLCLWVARDLLRRATVRFAWGGWLRRVVPLTLGAGTVQLLSTADVVYAQSVFPAEAIGFYIPAAMVGLAFMTYAAPLAQVMFPKVARSAAQMRLSRAMPLALAATSAGGIAGALAFTLFPGLLVRVLFFPRPEYWVSAPLVPWVGWMLLPLTVANVLLSSLLARERFRVVPWVMAVGAVYLGALAGARGWFAAQEPFVAGRALLLLAGGCNLLLLAVAVIFTARDPDRAAAAGPSA